MKPRRLSVSCLENRPWIRLTGLWLSRAGFAYRDKILVSFPELGVLHIVNENRQTRTGGESDEEFEVAGLAAGAGGAVDDCAAGDGSSREGPGTAQTERRG